jgi:aspartate racemase
VRPREAEIAFVHDAYLRLAQTAVVTDADRQRFVALADTLRKRDGVEAILLAGTDLAMMFDASNTPFPHLDCAPCAHRGDHAGDDGPLAVSTAP